MNQDLTAQLDNFAAEAARRTLLIQQAAGKDIARLSTEFSAYMTENMQAFMKLGVSVMDIQNRIRAAVEAVLSSESVPEADVDDRSQNSEVLEGEIGSHICFVPVDEKAVADFGNGVMDQDAFIEALSMSSEDVAVIEMSDGLAFVLTDFGKIPALDEVADGGEIVTDSTGEAFMPEYLGAEWPDDIGFFICEPVLFKFPDEVRTNLALIESIDEKTFYKKADIKKLIRSGWLEGYDERSVKKEADYIIGELWNEFVSLRKVYCKAAEQQKGLLLLTGYEGE